MQYRIPTLLLVFRAFLGLTAYPCDGLRRAPGLTRLVPYLRKWNQSISTSPPASRVA